MTVQSNPAFSMWAPPLPADPFCFFFVFFIHVHRLQKKKSPWLSSQKGLFGSFLSSFQSLPCLNKSTIRSTLTWYNFSGGKCPIKFIGLIKRKKSVTSSPWKQASVAPLGRCEKSVVLSRRYLSPALDVIHSSPWHKLDRQIHQLTLWIILKRIPSVATLNGHSDTWWFQRFPAAPSCFRFENRWLWWSKCSHIKWLNWSVGRQNIFNRIVLVFDDTSSSFLFDRILHTCF